MRERCALWTFDSVLRMVCWWRNTKAFHFVKQGSALQTKPGCGTSRASKLPVGALASRDNLFADFVFKSGVRDFGLGGLEIIQGCGLKDAIIGENDATRNVVLEL